VSPNPLEPSGSVYPCTGIALPLLIIFLHETGATRTSEVSDPLFGYPCYVCLGRSKAWSRVCGQQLK